VTSDSLNQRASLRADHVPLGILFMLGATVMFAGSTAIAKWQVATYPFSEVLFFRSIISLIVCSLLILPRHGWAVFRTNRLRDHAGRSVTQSVAQSLIVIALSLMPIAGAMAINFSAPLFALWFAALWLKEKIGAARGLRWSSAFSAVAGRLAGAEFASALCASAIPLMKQPPPAQCASWTNRRRRSPCMMLFMTGFHRRAAGVRLSYAERARCHRHDHCRPVQRLRAILVYACVIARTAFGGRAVLLLRAGLGDGARIHILG
jgi:hypothetical protein